MTFKKEVFDVWSNDFGYKQFKNSSSRFSEFLSHLSKNSWCVMEYTGSYYIYSCGSKSYKFNSDLITYQPR
ncbi:MAG: hypothetical protein PF485_13875 [Bacteroidales bacterium]|nr:hypothetical protein [Bacteroidales bacterium]